MKKRFLAFLLTFVMVLSMTACGTKAPVTVQSVIEAADKAALEAKNMQTSLKVDCAISTTGISMDVNANMDMSLFLDPLKAKASVGLSILGESLTLDVYLVNEEDTWYGYVNMDGSWSKQEIDGVEEMLALMNSSTYLDFGKELADQFTLSEVKENDKNMYKLEGSFNGEYIAAQMEKLKMDEIMSEMDGFSDFDTNIYKELGDIPVVYYIDKSTNEISRMTIDMTDAIQNAVTKTLEMLKDMEGMESIGEITIDKLTAEASCQLDKATDFELPAEAKDAVIN